jgi:hypothetical protein
MHSGSHLQLSTSKACDVPAGQTANTQTLRAPEKIMYLISDLSIGGAELTLYRLLARMDRRRFEPVVVSLMDRGSLRKRIETLGIEVRTLNMNSERPSLFDLFRLINLIKTLQPALIVGWMYHSCLAAEVATRFVRRRIPTIWSLHCAINPASVEKRRTVFIARLTIENSPGVECR